MKKQSNEATIDLVKDIFDDAPLQFITHKGEVISGERLTAALNKVADDYRDLQIIVREENAFASHVTEKEKEDYLFKFYAIPEQKVRAGIIDNFTAWQRINNVLTGECVAFLPK